jgi:hypothetical protein
MRVRMVPACIPWVTVFVLVLVRTVRLRERQTAEVNESKGFCDAQRLSCGDMAAMEIRAVMEAQPDVIQQRANQTAQKGGGDHGILRFRGWQNGTQSAVHSACHQTQGYVHISLDAEYPELAPDIKFRSFAVYSSNLNT